MTIPDEVVQAAHAEYHKVLGDSNRSNPMLAALTAALPFLQGVKAKALEWGESRGRWFQKSMAPRYEIIGGAIGDFVLQYNCQDLSRHPTLEAAVASAQADREARFWAMADVTVPAPTPRAQTLEEAARCVDAKADEYDDEAKDVRNSTDDKRLCRAISVRLIGAAAAIRALSSHPVSDGRPCSMDEFAAKLLEEKVDGFDISDAVREWVYGDWDAALSYLSEETAAAIRHPLPASPGASE